MKMLPTALALLAPAALSTAAPAQAQGGPPLTMVCHMLLGGFPQSDETVFMVIGSDMFSKSFGQTRRISTTGVPMYLGRTVDKGVVTLTYADHVRVGRTVTRRVYWKEGAQPRRLRFTERYDFLNQTIRSPGDPDSCHHNGK